MEGIYIFEAVGLNLFKIGWSQDIDGRFLGLYQGSPFQLKQTAKFPCRRKFLRALEKFLHDRYASKRVNGEWFRLTETDIKEAETVVTKWKIENGAKVEDNVDYKKLDDLPPSARLSLQRYLADNLVQHNSLRDEPTRKPAKSRTFG